MIKKHCHTFSEPTVAVSGSSINNSGTLKDSILSFTALEKAIVHVKSHYDRRKSNFLSKVSSPWESEDRCDDECCRAAGDDGQFAISRKTQVECWIKGKKKKNALRFGQYYKTYQEYHQDRHCHLSPHQNLTPNLCQRISSF